jgi:predicted Zn-dependent peptidase
MKRKLSTLIFVVLLAVLNSLSVLSASNGILQNDSKSAVQPLPKGVSIHQLDNGMQVLLIENPALPMVGVNVAVKIGSAYETFSTSGMSHMLEHLLFNGTTTRTQKQLYDDVDRIGGYNNASTADFYTNYMMVMPAENTKEGMELQVDMLFNSTLPEDKFEKEKGIVLEEISKSLANPSEQFERNTASILYNGHALSLPTLGTYSTIQSMRRDDVHAFYKNNYVPNNMLLTAIGNFQSAAMLSMIKEVYGKAEPGLVRRDVQPEWYTGFQKPDVSMIQTGFLYNRFYDGKDISLQVFYPLPEKKSSEFFKLLNIVLEKSKDEIQNALKTEFADVVKSLRLSTRSSHFQNFVEAVVLVNKYADYSELINSLSKKLANINFTLSEDAIKSEVTKARTEFLKNIEKPHMFGIYNSHEIVTNGLESVLESYTGSKYYTAVRDLDAVKLSTPELIIIQSPSVKAEAEDIESISEIKFFDEEEAGKTLIVVQNQLSNLLAVHYLIKHKASYESKYGKDAAKILHDCLEQRMKSDENQKKSSQFGFTFVFNDNPYIPMDDIYLHPDFGYIRAEGLADELDGAINFLNSQFKDFIPTEDEFNKAVEKFKGIEMMQMGGDKAKKLFDDTYKPLIYEPEPYTGDKPALSYDNLKAFAKEYFQPANMIISLVSPASCDSVKALFSQFRSTSTTEKLPVYRKSLLLQENAAEIEKDGKGERSYLFWGFTAQIDPADAPPLQALSLILSDNIVFDIREKQGMAYHMSAGIEIIDDKALFYINQGTRPQNVDTLVSQYPGFFGKKLINELTEDELEKSINMYLGRMMFRRLSSINQAFYLGSSLYFHGDFNYDKNFHEKLKNVKLSDVKDAAKKYLNIKNPVLVIVR